MYEALDRDEVLATVKRWGALLPLEVKRKLGKGESVMIGAVLSELAHNKRVAITKLKKGGSPYYYDPHQPQALEAVADALGEKDKRTYDLLKEQRVIDPETVEPLTRVSLGNIPDYSYDFVHEGKKYYRYFLTSEQEAIELLSPKKEAQEAEEKLPLKTPARETSEQVLEHSASEHPTNTPDLEKPAPTPKKKPAQKSTAPKKTVQQPKQQTLAEPSSEKQVLPEDEFLDEIKTYCKEKKIIIQSAEVIRKNSELDLVVRVPSSIGRITYFAKAKSKKKSNDGDVATALLGGQMRRLPALYITTGEVTNKAKEMTKKELKGVVIKEI